MNQFLEKIIEFFKDKASVVLSFLLITIIGFFLIKLLLKFIKKIIAKSKIDIMFHRFFLSLIKIFLYILLMIIALSSLGVDLTSLVAMLSVIGVAIGLAIQSSLSNMASGIIILFTKPFHIGDFVEINSVTGTVNNINIIQTKLLTTDNKSVLIPNSEVYSSKIINYSTEPKRRLDVFFSISYNDDFIFAQKLIKEVIAKNEFALEYPEPIIRVCEHSQNAIKIIVRVWVENENYLLLNYDLLESVKVTFDKNNITFPFSQLDIHLKNNYDIKND